MKTKTICVLNGKVVMMNNKKKGTATIVSEKVYHLEASLPSGRKESGQKGQNLVTSLGSFASK